MTIYVNMNFTLEWDRAMCVYWQNSSWVRSLRRNLSSGMAIDVVAYGDYE